MTNRCGNWMRTWQRGNMPILLKTQAERTAKTPIPARRARVGGLCRFCSPVERVPTGSRKTGRCADVRERCGTGKRRRKPPTGGFRRRAEPQAAKQDKAAGSCAPPQRSHLPAVRAVLGLCEGIVERAKIAPMGSQFEKSPPFQGKQRDCTKKARRNRTNIDRCDGR